MDRALAFAASQHCFSHCTLYGPSCSSVVLPECRAGKNLSCDPHTRKNKEAKRFIQFTQKSILKIHFQFFLTNDFSKSNPLMNGSFRNTKIILSLVGTKTSARCKPRRYRVIGGNQISYKLSTNTRLFSIDLEYSFIQIVSFWN